ncbi:IclR family transcriptional regulator [Dactylosporangium sucinum]|nr:IclR family transcriptional regulator [Dactylosporangium sucinum]
MRNEERQLGSVSNALRLLEAMAPKSLCGVSELSRTLQISKTSIDRLLTTLVAAGFAEQDPNTRKYRLTKKIVSLADRVRSRTSMVELARPHLAALAAQVGEAANLGVFVDGHLVYLDTIASTHTFQIEARAGSRLPAHCTAGGKAILAYSRPDLVNTYLAEFVPVAHTRFTLCRPALLRQELTRIRRQGFALDQGEFLEEAWCAAAPVLGEDGHAVAAVSVTAPKSRFTVKRDELVSHVTATANRIAAVISPAADVAAPPGA